MGTFLWSLIYGGASHQRGLFDFRHREVGKDVSAGTVNDSTDAGVVERARQTPIGRTRIVLYAERQELCSLPRRRTDANRFVREGKCATRDRHGRRGLVCVED